MNLKFEAKCALYLASMAVCNTISSNLQAGEAGDFIAFTQSPPVIKRLVFAAECPLEGVTNYFLAKWQPDAMFINKAKLLANLFGPIAYTEARTAGGRYGTNYWGFDHNWIYLWRDAKNEGLGARNDATVLIKNYLKGEVENVMNCGVPNADIGAIKWHGSQFEVNTRSGALSGALKTNNAGIPVELTYTPLTPGATVVVHIAYEVWRSNAFGLLPNVIELYTEGKGVKQVYRRYLVLGFETNSARLPASEFSYESILSSDVRGFVDISNAGKFWEYDYFKEQSLRVLGLMTTRSQIRAAYLVLIVGFTLLCLGLLLTLSRVSNKRKLAG